MPMESLFEFISSTGDGACAVDRQQRIVLWNDAARDLLGFEPAEARGKYCYEVLGGTDEAGCSVCRGECPALEVGSRTGIVPTREICARSKDGQKVWLSVSTVLVPSPWRDLSVLVHLFRDVSIQKWTEGVLEQMLEGMGKLLLTPATNGSPSHSVEDLSARQREILRMMASGMTTNTIAGRLFITNAAVRDHVQNIFTTLGVQSRLEAVILALRSGLL